ncbi:MAG: lipopolysaccharide biosynthesis protein [Gammaproteobacteria bacterium]|nr:lipopolysaccharide biosynthesis protein [Gammaproteobacteria bacterium]
MEEDEKGLGDYLAILRRRKKQLIIPALIVFLLSVVLAFALPATYRSEATILIEQQSIPQDLVRSTVTSYAGERISMISQRVMTSVNLKRIIEQYGLYIEERKNTSLTILVEEMREDISLEMISADVIDPRSGRPTTATIAFKLAFSHKSARTSQKVTNELVSLYLNENLKRRTQTAVETSGFLATEVVKLQEQVITYEAKLADFKESNIKNLPELQQLNVQLMQRVEQNIQDAERQIRTLDERKIYLQSELVQMSPTSDLFTADGKRVLGDQDRLTSLRSEYASLSARYSETHPNLVKLKKEITALKKTVGVEDSVGELKLQLKMLKAERTTLRERYSAEHPDVKKVQRTIDSTLKELEQASKERRVIKVANKTIKPDNPAYIQLQAQLNAANGEISALREAKVGYQEKLNDIEERLLQSPQVERQYRDLTRGYENALAKFQEVKAKQLEAELAEALEREKKGERFSLIEPPQTPEKPASPNRLAIVFLGFVLSMAGGIGTVSVAEGLSNVIRDPRSLIRITGAAPLVTIPYIEIAADRKKARAVKRNMILVILILGASTVAAFHFLYMPLDVAWFVALRRFGIEL